MVRWYAARCHPWLANAPLPIGGKLVVPVKDRLYVVERTADGVERRALERVRFVPLI